MRKIKKIDLKNELKDLVKAKPAECRILCVPSLKYLSVEGKGDPSSADFSEAVSALYGLAYTMKFMFKKALKNPIDYPVMMLEGLWYADDINAYLRNERKEWKWNLLITLPNFIGKPDLEKARKAFKIKKTNKYTDQIRIKTIKEGRCAQIMHVGPYSAERATIEKLHSFILESGYTFNGSHHEIYLSDPKKTAAVKMRTILRHPIKKA